MPKLTNNEKAILNRLPIGHSLIIETFKIGGEEGTEQVVTARCHLNSIEDGGAAYVWAGWYLLALEENEKLKKLLEA